jgi:CspA family cold shock protein
MPSAADSGALTRGDVLEWYAEEGWGVLTSPSVDGTVFAHYSMILDQEGYRSLEKGQAVYFRWRPGGQDGCDNQAIEGFHDPRGKADTDTSSPARRLPVLAQDHLGR